MGNNRHGRTSRQGPGPGPGPANTTDAFLSVHPDSLITHQHKTTARPSTAVPVYRGHDGGHTSSLGIRALPRQLLVRGLGRGRQHQHSQHQQLLNASPHSHPGRAVGGSGDVGAVRERGATCCPVPVVAGDCGVCHARVEEGYGQLHEVSGMGRRLTWQSGLMLTAGPTHQHTGRHPHLRSLRRRRARRDDCVPRAKAVAHVGAGVTVHLRLRLHHPLPRLRGPRQRVPRGLHLLGLIPPHGGTRRVHPSMRGSVRLPTSQPRYPHT